MRYQHHAKKHQWEKYQELSAALVLLASHCVRIQILTVGLLTVSFSCVDHLRFEYVKYASNL